MSTKERLHELVDELSEAEAAHARIVVETASKPVETLSGSLPHLPDLSWEDFERASERARRDLTTT